MKKIAFMRKLTYSLLAALLLVAAAVVLHKTKTGEQELFQANVEALTQSEGTPTMPCLPAVSICTFPISDANGNTYSADVTGFKHI